jgi:hypothetical protein
MAASSTITAAYLVMATSLNASHQGVDAIRHPNMRSCMDQLQMMVRETRPSRPVIIDGPKCTDSKPSWWKD